MTKARAIELAEAHPGTVTEVLDRLITAMKNNAELEAELISFAKGTTTLPALIRAHPVLAAGIERSLRKHLGVTGVAEVLGVTTP